MTPGIRTAALAAALIAAGLPASAGLARNFELTVSPFNVGSGSGNWVAIADVNNDGRDDLLNVVDLNNPDTYDTLAIRLQGPDRKLGSPIGLSMPMANIQSVEGVDLDGDGTIEVVAGFDGGVIVYRWNGTEFVPSVRNASVDCRQIAIADLDGNGTRDILCQSMQQVASIFMVDALGEPGAPAYFQTTTSPGYAGRQIQLADVTGDGLPDLLEADIGLWGFFLYENDGAGGFLPARAFGLPREVSGFTSDAIEAIDADGDGANEIAVAITSNVPRSRVLLYRRDANGEFASWKTLAAKDGPEALLTHDVDGDGHMDLLVAHRGWSTIGRYMGSAAGLEETEILSGNIMAGVLDTHLASGDLDGDGRMDVAVNNVFEVGVKYGMGTPSRDVSGNLQSDLVWRNPATGANVLWNDARGEASTVLASVSAPWNIVAIADFDDDGKADVFWRNPTNGANMIWRSGDPGTLQATAPVAASWKVAATGDFDGDGKADILWRYANSGLNALWPAARNDRARAITAIADPAWQVAGAGDFDGDRSDDVLWRNTTTGANLVWFSADSTTAVPIASVSSMDWKVAGIGDFDGDAMDDILWRNTKTGANTIWRSADGRRQQPVATAAPAWTVAAIGDFSGDRVDDIAWRNPTSGANVIWYDALASKPATLMSAATAWQVVP